MRRPGKSPSQSPRGRGLLLSIASKIMLHYFGNGRNRPECFFPPHSMSSDSHARSLRVHSSDRVPPAARWQAGWLSHVNERLPRGITDHPHVAPSRHRPCNPTAPAASLSPLTHQRLTHARALIIIHHHNKRKQTTLSTHRMEEPSDAAACAFAFRSSRAQLASSTGPSGASSPWPPRAGSGRGAAWSPPAWSSPCPPAGLSS